MFWTLVNILKVQFGNAFVYVRECEYVFIVSTAKLYAEPNSNDGMKRIRKWSNCKCILFSHWLNNCCSFCCCWESVFVWFEYKECSCFLAGVCVFYLHLFSHFLRIQYETHKRSMCVNWHVVDWLEISSFYFIPKFSFNETVLYIHVYQQVVFNYRSKCVCVLAIGSLWFRHPSVSRFKKCVSHWKLWAIFEHIF